MKITVTCLRCGKQANRPYRARARYKFCSSACSNKSHAAKKLVEHACEICGKSFRARRSAQRRFCSQRCTGSFTRTLLKSKRSADPQTHRRRYVAHLVAQKIPLACEHCGFDNPREILHLHHKDSNRKNGNLSNLILLCPNCHETTHFVENSGHYGVANTLRGHRRAPNHSITEWYAAAKRERHQPPTIP